MRHAEKGHELPRIAMYCRYFPPDVSGAGIQALKLCRKLRILGHTVVVVADNAGNAPSQESIEGIPVHRIGKLDVRPSYLAVLAYWLRLSRIFFALRRDYDIIHAHGVSFENSFVAVIARVLGKPILMKTSLAGEFSSAGQSLSKRLQYRLLSHVDLFVAISRDLLTEYETNTAFSKCRIELVPNGVDTSAFAPVDRETKRRLREEQQLPQTPILTYHGVFMARKSLDWLIEATEDLLVARRFTLLLIGDPARDESTTGYYRELLRQAEHLIASGSVVLRGFQEDVHRYLQASDAYILPSKEEGLSNSLLEAMAVGLVPIASRTSGTKELIENKRNGLTFGVASVEELRQSIAYFLSIHGSDAEKSLQASARETIEKDYSLDSVAERYCSLYRQLEAARRPPRSGRRGAASTSS